MFGQQRGRPGPGRVGLDSVGPTEIGTPLKLLAPIILLLLAALGLAGCSSGSDIAGVPPEVVRQAWADEKIDLWIGESNANGIDELPEPFSHVESWESPAAGVLVVRAGSKDVHQIAQELLRSIRATGGEIVSVTVVNDSGDSAQYPEVV